MARNFSSLAVLLLTSILFATGPGLSMAQISYGGGRDVHQSIAPALVAIDFEFDGAGTPETSFEFTEPAIGIMYSRPGFAVSFARGVQRNDGDDDLTLTDALLVGYGAFSPFSDEPGKLEVIFPISLGSGYRKVSRESSTAVIEAFEFTTLSVGGGLGLIRNATRTSLWVRAVPYYGIATRSFGDDTGTTITFDADLEFAVKSIFNDRFGLVFGYGFRWQRWNLKASRFFTGISDETFDYSGTMNSVRVGLVF